MPAIKPFVAALTVRVCGAAPLVGEPVSQVWSLATVKLNVPLPVLVRFTIAEEGFAPPCVAPKDREFVERVKIGCVGAEVLPYAETGQSVYCDPWDHVAGNEARFVCELV